MSDAQDRPDPDIEALIEETLEESAQLLLGTAAPIGLLDELRATIQGPALRAVLEARIDQVAARGHTREIDAMLPIGWLGRRAIEMAQAATDRINATAEQRNLPVARARLARAAALCMAAIDRLDMIKGEGNDV